jgi:ubiquinone/menaquinone biosynthesis C-methylase UbiE
MEKLGNIEGKKVLDFGCGQGWLSEILIRKGAHVWAFDISKEAVKKLKIKSLERFSPERQPHLFQMPAENLAFHSNSFDYIIGNAILHHTDLETSAREIHRVLKRGGRAYFMEPLGHNILLNWYRKKTPDLRSPDEKPLRCDDFKVYEKLFTIFHHEESYFLVMLSLFWYFIFRNDRLILKTRNFLIKVDNLILNWFPYLRKYCWYSILVMEK